MEPNPPPHNEGTHPSDTPLILFCPIHKKPYSILGYRPIWSYDGKRIIDDEPIYECAECVFAP